MDAQVSGMSLAAAKIALILNPAATDDASSIVELVRSGCRGRGCDEVTVEQTTTTDPGSSQARRAVIGGTDLVIVCGGDGTVAAVADGLAHSGIPMAVIATGTGNLLCRNLGIPRDVRRALDVALGEHTRVIDLGRIDENCFVVMAGVGFDASVMRDTSEKLKTRIGWLAYVLAGARNLVHRPMFATIRLDEHQYVQGAVRTVLIGNVGRLQGGVSVLPDADPSDGALDVVIVAPRDSSDWLAIAWQIIRRQRRPDARLRRFQARRIEIEADRSVPRQFDGEVMPSARCLHVEVDPAALVVKVPS
jgi:YegS/Rv2252/BmrU family lipid kinase